MEGIGGLMVSLVVVGFMVRAMKRRILAGLYKLTGSRRVTAWAYGVIFLPGTYFHEMSHALMAGILRVRIGKISMRPRLRGEKVYLGSVEVERVGVVRRLLVGIAPVIFGVVGIGVLYQLARWGEWSGRAWVVGGGLVFEIGSGMALSKKDLWVFKD